MKDFTVFAKEIGFNEQVLDNYATYSEEHYREYHVRKRNKLTTRTIASPSKELKAIQRWLVNNYFNTIPISHRATGFVKGKGIKHNAAHHLNKPYLLCLDIKDFFPSITQGMVFRTLKQHFEDEKLVFKLARLCTYRRALPQGAPTSPILSNIIFKEIDDKITVFCNSNLVNYSRYADDLVFSCNNKGTLTQVHAFINNLLNSYSFQLNSKKTKYFSGKGRMMVTGLNINEGRVTVSQSIKKLVRSMLYRLLVLKDKSVNVNVIRGYLSFIHDVEPSHHKKLILYIKKIKKK